MTPRRYQLNKSAARVVLSDHPWVYRSHLSSASDVFRDGQWLHLVGANNETLGYGVFHKEGLIGIRVLKRGGSPPNAAWVRERVTQALAEREPLRRYTDAFRAIHGENDRLPGIVVDVYGTTGVLQTYAPAVDALGRLVAARVCGSLGLKTLIWKTPAKRKHGRPESQMRVLRGQAPERVRFREGQMELTVGISAGQKSGTFLDLRGLRKWVAAQDLRGLRVLNLFAYTGTLGKAAEMAGAKEIWNVDVSSGALDFAKRHHATDPKRFRWICSDIFEWLPQLPERERFDVIIVDPPQMAAEMKQVPGALRAYQRLYRSALPHLSRGGTLIACCCTGRISRERFQQEVDGWLRSAGLRRKQTLLPEDDHPVRFPEGDYLKILVYR